MLDLLKFCHCLCKHVVVVVVVVKWLSILGQWLPWSMMITTCISWYKILTLLILWKLLSMSRFSSRLSSLLHLNYISIQLNNFCNNIPFCLLNVYFCMCFRLLLRICNKISVLVIINLGLCVYCSSGMILASFLNPNSSILSLFMMELNEGI